MSDETIEPGDAAAPQGTCPLCGGPNGCGIAAGAATCWCFSAAIPAATLARVPDSARDRRCICAACAGQTGMPAPSSDRS